MRSKTIDWSWVHASFKLVRIGLISMILINAGRAGAESSSRDAKSELDKAFKQRISELRERRADFDRRQLLRMKDQAARQEAIRLERLRREAQEAALKKAMFWQLENREQVRRRQPSDAQLEAKFDSERRQREAALERNKRIYIRYRLWEQAVRERPDLAIDPYLEHELEK